MAVYVNTKNMSKKTQAWICIIIGLIVGTALTFGMQYRNPPITKEAATYTEAVFSSYEEVRRNGSIDELIIHFKNHDDLTVDGTCCSQKVIDGVRSLKSDSTLKIYYHPNSRNIMEMICGGKVIVQFETASSRLAFDRQAFTVLGVFMYLCAAFGVIMLIREKRS